MNNKFTEYLNLIDLSSFLKETVIKKYIVLLRSVGLEEFDDIFISEITSNNGDREYFSLWGFTSTLFCKISLGKPIAEDQIVIFKLKGNIARFTYNEVNYDLDKADQKSILDTTIRTFDMDIPYFMRASGKNCDFLIGLIKKYFISAIND